MTRGVTTHGKGGRDGAIRMRLFVGTTALAVLAACSTAPASAPPGPQPAAEPATTGPAIETGRLETTVYAFAHDSMMGREAGTEGHRRAVRYLEDRARAYGLEPAGEDGTYLQEVPIVRRGMRSTVRDSSGPIEVGPDFAPLVLEDLNSPASLDFTGVPVVYGGDMAGPNEISAEEGTGKIVVLGAARGPDGRAFGLVGPTLQKLQGAAAVLMASNDYADTEILEFLLEPQVTLDGGADGETDTGEGPLLAFVSEALVERLFGEGVDALQAGTERPALTGTVEPSVEPVDVPTYNVIARIPGSDPALRDEHVVLSAHSDHVGFSRPALPHDSLRAYLEVVRPGGAEDPEREPTPEEAEQIRAILAEQGRSNRPDSINNGADDDASGSMALLEVGRVIAASAERPRRSVLLVWHTAEEGGLLGARYYTDNPTVPREQMVTTVNIDMIGRGTVEDTELGGPGYLQLIGSRRLSTQLGDLVEEVNRREGHGFDFDYQYDAEGHPQQFYCRSDHYMYARYGIPVVFMSTGGHRDYHQRTDEAQYIDYEKLASVSAFAHDLVVNVANLAERPVVDGPVPDPNAPCQQ